MTVLGIVVLAIIGLILIVIGVLYFVFYDRSDGLDYRERSQALSLKYSTDMNRYQAGKEGKASEARGGLLANLEVETNRMANVLVQQAAVEIAHHRKQDAFTDYSLQREREQSDHALYLAMNDNKRRCNEIAGKFGLSPNAFEELVLTEARAKLELQMKKEEMLIDVERAKLLKQIEIDTERAMADLQVKLANIANLLPQHKYNLLSKQLSGYYAEYENAKQLEDGEFKENEIKRLKGAIEKLEGEIEEGLF